MSIGIGSNGAGALWKIAASVITAAIVAIAGFTFSMASNVAVLAEGYRNQAAVTADLSARVRQLEQEINVLKVEIARLPPTVRR